MKKFISILICSFLIFSFVAVSYAQEAESENYGYIPYERNDTNYAIPKSNSVQTFSMRETLPTSYDSRNYGFVSPVKDQGSGNTCWSFAAIGALESYMLKYYGEKDEEGKAINTNEFNFSENHMQYMMSSWNNNPLGFEVGTGSKSGGNALMSSNYYMNDFGPVCETADKYENISSRDYSATKDIPKSDYKVDSVAFLPQILQPDLERLNELESNLSVYEADSETYAEELEEYYSLKSQNDLFNNRYAYLDDIKRLVKDYGSVVCGVYYDKNKHKYLSADNKYVYCGKNTGVNHQVLIVGWDDNFLDRDGMSNAFNLPGNNNVPPELKGAFIVKNSWGENSCDNGYFYLSYCDYNLFFDLMAITGVSERNKREILYNLDPYGKVNTHYEDGKQAICINNFERKTTEELLTAIRFYAYKGYNYDVYLEDQLIMSGLTSEYDGYYTVQLNEPKVVENDVFAIVIKVYSYGAEVVPIPFECNAMAYSGDKIVDFISKAEANEEESYLINQHNQVYIFNNFCIKAITETTDSYSEFELANFTDEKGNEKTEFTEGDTVYIVPALNGANLDGKQIICVGYDGNKAVKMIQYKNFTSNGQNRFTIENIPSDFSDYTFYMYVWEMSGLKPLGNGIKVGVEK